MDHLDENRAASLDFTADHAQEGQSRSFGPIPAALHHAQSPTEQLGTGAPRRSRVGGRSQVFAGPERNL
jgi:hypothetical protein